MQVSKYRLQVNHLCNLNKLVRLQGFYLVLWLVEKWLIELFPIKKLLNYLGFKLCGICDLILLCGLQGLL